LTDAPPAAAVVMVAAVVAVAFADAVAVLVIPPGFLSPLSL